MTVAATCTAPLAAGTASGTTKAICGTAGSGISGAVVKVYDSNGSLVNTGLTTTVNPDGSFLWKCNASTANCNSGPNCLSSGAYYVTQTASGQCESSGVWICISSNSTSATPVITGPVLSSATSVSGTAVANSRVYLYSGNVQIGQVAANASGAWTITPVSLSLGDVLTARTVESGKCASASSASVTVSRNSVASVVPGTYCTPVGTPITSVTGTSTEPAGTVIQVFKNGVAHGSTTTVNANGKWTASTGISFSPGDAITARATISGGIQSAASNSITVGSKTTTGATITTSPLIEGTTSVTGTGVNGHTVTLYVDGVQVGTPVTVSGGTWTISGLSSYDLYATGVFTVSASAPSSCESNQSAGVTVQCTPPASNLTVNPANASGQNLIRGQA